jgi:hypothetical protein
MDALRRASAFLFYVLGILTVTLILLSQKGIVGSRLTELLNVLDLPLLFCGMLFGGSSLYESFAKGRRSIPFMIVIFLPLAALFAFFLYCNFALPFPEA